MLQNHSLLASLAPVRLGAWLVVFTDLLHDRWETRSAKYLLALRTPFAGLPHRQRRDAEPWMLIVAVVMSNAHRTRWLPYVWETYGRQLYPLPARHGGPARPIPSVRRAQHVDTWVRGPVAHRPGCAA